jgi:TorA maturation chaperone TorD
MNELDTAQGFLDAMGELLFARRCLYTFFHKLFGGKPTSEMIDVISNPLLSDEARMFDVGGSTLATLAATLEVLSGQSRNTDFLWRLEAEYTRAFVGPSTLPAMPWETPYLTHEASFMSERTVIVKRLYRSLGLEMKAGDHVPADHVSLLCDLMRYQSEDARRAFREHRWEELRRCLEQQCVICRDHLVSWIPMYAEKMSSMKDAVLYPKAVQGLSSFVQQDETFCASAMLWLDEQVSTLETLVPCLDVSLGKEAFLVQLDNLRLPFLEDNELNVMSEHLQGR